MSVDHAGSIDPAGSIEHAPGDMRRRGPDPAAPFGCPVFHDRLARSGGNPDDGSRKGRSKRGYFVPGLIALVVLAVGGGLANFAGLDHAAPDHLAGPEVQTSLAQAIQSQDHLVVPPRISCPASEPVRPGLSFTCTWQQTGGNRPVTVTETDARGQFRFSVGRASA